jgi:hypothetical protein
MEDAQARVRHGNVVEASRELADFAPACAPRKYLPNRLTAPEIEEVDGGEDVPRTALADAREHCAVDRTGVASHGFVTKLDLFS